jgi:formylglycine-generating enzyme required for sulfatase activity
MLFMTGGVFRMGSDEGDPGEQPSHLVRLDPYFIDETEVTNGQYASCAEAGACSPPRSSGATYHPTYYGDPAFDDYPVIFVSWYDAEAFCQWRGGRLPTEAEWEKGAGYDPIQAIKLRFPWGDAFSGDQVNFCDRNCPLERRDPTADDGHRDTAPVGSYPGGRSPVGLYEMAGNVMEWVSDWYDPRYYRISTDINPLGPLQGEFKALRGGSWLSAEEGLQVTVRGSYDPTVARANLGFRCAASIP